MSVLCSVDHGLLATLEVHKAFSTGLDVKSHAASDRAAFDCLHFCLSRHYEHMNPDSVPALDHFDVVLPLGNDTQLGQGLKQVVALQHQIPLKEQKCKVSFALSAFSRVEQIFSSVTRSTFCLISSHATCRMRKLSLRLLTDTPSAKETIFKTNTNVCKVCAKFS